MLTASTKQLELINISVFAQLNTSDLKFIRPGMKELKQTIDMSFTFSSLPLVFSFPPPAVYGVPLAF